MSLSRRQFIQASGIALCAGAVPLNAVIYYAFDNGGNSNRYPFRRCLNLAVGNRCL